MHQNCEPRGCRAPAQWPSTATAPVRGRTPSSGPGAPRQRPWRRRRLSGTARTDGARPPAPGRAGCSAVLPPAPAGGHEDGSMQACKHTITCLCGSRIPATLVLHERRQGLQSSRLLLASMCHCSKRTRNSRSRTERGLRRDSEVTMSPASSNTRKTPANGARHSGQRRRPFHRLLAHAAHTPLWPQSTSTASGGRSKQTRQVLASPSPSPILAGVAS